MEAALGPGVGPREVERGGCGSHGLPNQPEVRAPRCCGARARRCALCAFVSPGGAFWVWAHLAHERAWHGRAGVWGASEHGAVREHRADARCAPAPARPCRAKAETAIIPRSSPERVYDIKYYTHSQRRSREKVITTFDLTTCGAADKVDEVRALELLVGARASVREGDRLRAPPARALAHTFAPFLHPHQHPSAHRHLFTLELRRCQTRSPLAPSGALCSCGPKTRSTSTITRAPTRRQGSSINELTGLTAHFLATRLQMCVAAAMPPDARVSISINAVRARARSVR